MITRHVAPTPLLKGRSVSCADIVRASTDCCAASADGRSILTVGRDGIVQLLALNGDGYRAVQAWIASDFHGEFEGAAEALDVLSAPYAVITTNRCNIFRHGKSMNAEETDGALDGTFATLLEAISHVSRKYDLPATVAYDSVVALAWGADNPDPQAGERKTIIDRASARSLRAISL